MEDLAQGIGKLTQTRGNTTFELGKVALPYGVKTEEELKALDVSNFSLATIFSLFGPIEYEYDPSGSTGIPSDFGGYWVELLSVKDIEQDERLDDLGGTVVSVLKAVALALNIPRADVADTTSVLPIPPYLHDIVEETTYSVPVAAQGELIISVVGDVLTTNAGVYDLVDTRELTAKASAAISLNVGDDDIILDTDTLTPIPGYVYSVGQQTTYLVPSAAVGQTIISVVGNVLTASGGVYALIELRRREFDTVQEMRAGEFLVGDRVTTSAYNLPIKSEWLIIAAGSELSGQFSVEVSSGLFAALTTDHTAKALGASGVGDETDILQAVFDSTESMGLEVFIDVDMNLDTNKNVVQNTDPRPPIDLGDTSTAAVIINHKVKCHSTHKVTALAGVSTTDFSFLFSTNTDDGIDLNFEMQGNRDGGAPTSSVGIQVNSHNVRTKMRGGDFGSAPLILNGATRLDPLLEQFHDDHVYKNVGNSIFCRFVKGGQAKNWNVTDVSEGVDLDKTCDGMNLDNWTVAATRDSGADAAIEMNGAINCTANNLVSIGYKTGVILNAKERYDEPGVYDPCINCHVDDALIVSPTAGGIIVGNITGDFTDTINCSTDRAKLYNCTGNAAISVAGTNYSAKDCEVYGGDREGLLVRGGNVNADGFISYDTDRTGVDVLDGADASLRNARIENPNKAAGGYNGITVADGASANVVGSVVIGAAEYSIRKVGLGALTYGSNVLTGALENGLRYSSTSTNVQVSSGSGSVFGSVELGRSGSTFYASKSYAANTSLGMVVGDVLIHTDATELGDFYGRVCYQVSGSIPLFRNFGEVV
jgi:hypothetical protein